MSRKGLLFASILCFVCAGLALAPVAMAQPVDAGVVPDNDVLDPEKVIDDNIAKVDGDPGAAVSQVIDDFKAGHWELAIGGLIMILIWVMRKFLWTTIPTKALPWLALALGAVSDMSRLLIAGEVWWQALIGGLLTGGAAMLLWSTVGKALLPDPK